MPTVVIATTEFAGLARRAAGTVGLPDARIALVEHPIGGIDDDGLRARADNVIEALVALL